MKLSLKGRNKLNLVFLLLGLVYFTGVSSIDFAFWQKEIAFMVPLQALAIAYVFWFNQRYKNKL